MCDGIFIKACAEFILNEEVEHIQYTDSSSARQLACRQGSGRVRHLSGKILWVQEKTEDGSVVLRQVGTSENLADIGTKCLTRQRLLYLMHETGLIYIPSFEDVGQEEFSRHTEKVGGAAQIKRIAKAIYRMSLAMGLEPLNRPTGAMAFPDVCHGLEDEPKYNAWWILTVTFLFICVFTIGFLAWKRLSKRVLEAEIAVGDLQVSLAAVEQQLADHYEFAAELDTRLNTAGEVHDALVGRHEAFEHQVMENLVSMKRVRIASDMV
jgi:hypothetical protein